MKTKFYLILSSSLLILLQSQAQQQTPESSLPDGTSSAWFTDASAKIHSFEYGFRPAGDNTFRVSNSNNRLAFQINARGYSVYPMQELTEINSWKASFTLQSFGRKNSIATFGKTGTFVQQDNQLTEALGSVQVQYINNEKGLRQNFILNAKPAGESELVINISLQSELSAKLINNNQLIYHTPGNSSDIKMSYEDLKVWDARHEPMAAHMELAKDGKTLSIIVDDKDAVYPLTIDPMNKTPEWTTSANGILPGLLNNLALQVQTLYGYSVVGLGDINGDNYDDVAVSAPGMANVVSGTGSLLSVGAVFIYMGGPTGLSSTPNKVLQPTTTVGSILFGFSMAAGNITADGLNDVLVSAPLDQYQTSASVLLGTVNVNVTAGKVYFYRSEDLLASSNPTPFVQIRLQGTGFFSAGIAGLLASNVSAKALFGYSLSTTSDLNGDGREDVVIGAPAYLGLGLLPVQSGAAYIYYSNNLGTTTPVELDVPTPSLLGIVGLPIANLSGLLFGYSVDGVGDFNGDNHPDVVIGAPAGADLSSLGGIFSGQILGGTAYVYYGTGSGISTAIGAKLQASSSGLLSNAANLFGYKIRGVRNGAGQRNGNVLISAPTGGVLSNITNGLRLKAGQVHVFTKRSGVITSPVTSDQILSSPRATAVTSLLIGQNLNVSLLYGADMDNMRDINCDGNSDIIIGEPLSTNVMLIGANVTGGAAYIYLGKPDGTYKTIADWNVTTSVSPLLGINATALVGWSVAGAGHTNGAADHIRAIVGGPANSLDFGAGLLNLGNTLGTLTDFAFDNNGLGKGFVFETDLCGFATLPTKLLSFKGRREDKVVNLDWESASEPSLNRYELERSIDGTNFSGIAIVFAKGTSSNKYTFPDKHPALGINYYRLRMIDNDGKFNYSNTVSVRFDEKLPGLLVAMPNPVREHINIQMTGYIKGTYWLRLYSTTGQLLQAKQVTIDQHEETIVMNRTKNTPAGVYWLMIYDANDKKLGTVRLLFAGQ